MVSGGRGRLRQRRRRLRRPRVPALIERRLGPARVVWTDRHEGNLSVAVGDAPGAVEEHRRRLAEHLGLGDPASWQWLRQVHGSTIVDAAPPRSGSGATGPGGEDPEADGAITDRLGVPLVVLTADCAPVALASDEAVGAVHAGWRGLVAGVIEAAVERLRERGTGPVRAALGPCVHPGQYEFGGAELEAVVARLGPGVVGRTDGGTPALDVPAAVRAALARAGVEHVDDVDVGTASSPDYFSHRRDGPTGRQAMVVVRVA